MTQWLQTLEALAQRWAAPPVPTTFLLTLRLSLGAAGEVVNTLPANLPEGAEITFLYPALPPLTFWP